jgi:CCR4-NOT complex subunit CAF16
MNPVVRGDIKVEDFLNSVGGYRHKVRRDILLEILDVDLDWHMHAISDGERRRVQLVMGLMGDWDVLLLDEVYAISRWYRIRLTQLRLPLTWTCS